MNAPASTVSRLLPAQVAVSPMKLARTLGIESVPVDFTRVTDRMLADFQVQAAKYYIDAAISHLRAKLAAGQGSEGEANFVPPREPTAEEIAETLDSVIARFYDPNWTPARPSGAVALSPAEKFLREVVSEKLAIAGVLVRKSKTREAVTLDMLVEKFGGLEEAFRAGAESYIRAKGVDRNGVRYTEEKVRDQVEASWKVLKAEVAKRVKAAEADPFGL